ncbi:MAG TPA: tryptophan 7-halogenase [Steroidobacteraceae bacterium]|jgi:tryptophan halogenase|nr:tryptophan 7-halogenase [Steroidobacteraceae bacterium]
MTAHQPLSSVVVVGRDADLWLSVNAISRALRQAGVNVVAIELPSRLKPSHVSASLPPLEAFHAKLGIKEPSLIRATGGSFSFGQNIVAISARMPNFFHAWGAYGAPIDGSAFFPCWFKATRHGLKISFQNFCLTAVAAQNGRMLLPDEATTAFGRTDYGYHMQTMAYAGYLKSIAAAHGVKMHEARNISVEREENGSIAALVIDGSLRVEGQLFVDATGEDAILIGRSLGVPCDSWRQNFSVDRVLVGRAPVFTSIPPFAEIRTARRGWTALHPSQVATGVVHAYSSGLSSEEAALESASSACGVTLADVSVRPANPSIRSRVWEGNCVAVGGSACSLDPIHDVELHALQLGVVHLLSLFPVTEQFTVERTEYNRIMRSHYERIRDFQCAFYALSSFDGEFWQRARERAVPQSLSHKIATFRARGEIAPMEDETFLPESWQAIFTGLGVVPDSWPPSIDRISPDRFKQEFHRALEFIKGKVLEQPTHDGYLDSVCRNSTA